MNPLQQHFAYFRAYTHVKWAAAYPGPVSEAIAAGWASAPPTLLLWWASQAAGPVGSPERRRLGACLADVVEPTLRHVVEGEERPRRGLELLRAYLAGDPGDESQLQALRRAAEELKEVTNPESVPLAPSEQEAYRRQTSRTAAAAVRAALLAVATETDWHDWAIGAASAAGAVVDAHEGAIVVGLLAGLDEWEPIPGYNRITSAARAAAETSAREVVLRHYPSPPDFFAQRPCHP